MTIADAPGHPAPMGALQLEEPRSAADFAAVYRRDFDYVWSCLRALGVHDAELEDGAQAVFMVVHRRLGEFDGRAQLRTWLFAIAARVAARGRRDHARARRRVLALADDTPRVSGPDELDDAIASREVLALMQRFAEGLEPAMHEVFTAWFFDGRTPQEIADALGLSRNTVFSRLRLIKARLQRVCERIAAHDDATIDARARRNARTRVQAVVLGLGVRAPWTMAIVGVVGVLTVAVGVLNDARTPTIEEPTIHAALDDDTPASVSPVVDAATLPMTAPPSIVVAPETPRARARGAAAKLERPPVEDDTADLAASVALLAEIRAAIQAGDDASASRSIADHHTRFPAGPLAAERDGFAAIVACRSRADQAPARAYVAAHPDTAMSRRVASICERSSDDAPR